MVTGSGRMSEDIPFRRDFAFAYGRLEPVAPGVRRIIARNPGPFTFKGTGTYVVGEGEVAVIDPGPDLPEHVEALLAGLKGERITHILVTHTHRDHSPAARSVKQATGAPTYGFGPHAGGRRGEAGTEEGGDWDFSPDIAVRDGDVIAGGGWRFEAVHTPGHTSNHLCFALPDCGILFSGDHVMGWSTSVVAPPDGDMAAYMASLDKLLTRDDAVYWPTHGPAITEPRRHVRAFITHRRLREAGIVRCLRSGLETIDAIVERLYAGLDPALHRAAGRSVLAHLIDLIGRDIVTADGRRHRPRLAGRGDSRRGLAAGADFPRVWAAPLLLFGEIHRRCYLHPGWYETPKSRRKNVVKSARPLLIAALLAAVAACSPTKPETTVTPVAALPDAPPMVTPIAPPPAPFASPTTKKHKVAAKRSVKQHKVVKKTGKPVKVAKKHPKKHHAKTAHTAARNKQTATKLASRVKPGPASVPLDSPAPAPTMRSGSLPPIAPPPVVR
jgi:glyoxylase-like metal-dependent hydrolase (beta-lactamase superfamily II)